MSPQTTPADSETPSRHSESAQQTVNAATVQAQVEAAIDAYGRALVTGDIDATLDRLTPEVHMLTPNRNLKGKAAHEEFRRMLSGAKVVGFEMRSIEFFVHGDDVAYTVSEYDEVVEIDGTTLNDRGYIFLRWTKGPDGKWRYDRFVASPRELPPEQFKIYAS